MKTNEYGTVIQVTEAQNNIPPGMLYRLIKQESRFNPRAVSKRGAQGIAQFMPGTAREMGIDPFDPDQAISAAGEYLAQQFKRFGSWDKAAMAYNWGPENLSKYVRGGEKGFIPKETLDYVDVVVGDKTTYPTVKQRSKVEPAVASQTVVAKRSATPLFGNEDYSVDDENVDVNLDVNLDIPLGQTTLDTYLDIPDLKLVQDEILDNRVSGIVDEVLNG